MTNICDACESAHVRLRHSFQLPVSQLGFYCIWLNYLKFVELHRISSYFLSIRAPLPALSRAERFFFILTFLVSQNVRVGRWLHSVYPYLSTLSFHPPLVWFTSLGEPNGSGCGGVAWNISCPSSSYSPLVSLKEVCINTGHCR